jgi:hypothetical protein
MGADQGLEAEKECPEIKVLEQLSQAHPPTEDVRPISRRYPSRSGNFRDPDPNKNYRK